MKLPKYFTQTKEIKKIEMGANKKPSVLGRRVKIASTVFVTTIVVTSVSTILIAHSINNFFETHYLSFHPVIEARLNAPYTIENRVKPIAVLPVVVYNGETLERLPQSIEVKAPSPRTERQKFVASLIETMWGKDANKGKWLAYCESGYGTNNENSESTASGVFMFIDGSWTTARKAMGVDQDLKWKLDTAENIRTGYSYFKSNGLTPWEASKSCWGVAEL